MYIYIHHNVHGCFPLPEYSDTHSIVSLTLIYWQHLYFFISPLYFNIIYPPSVWCVKENFVLGWNTYCWHQHAVFDCICSSRVSLIQFVLWSTLIVPFCTCTLYWSRMMADFCSLQSFTVYANMKSILFTCVGSHEQHISYIQKGPPDDERYYCSLPLLMYN